MAELTPREQTYLGLGYYTVASKLDRANMRLRFQCFPGKYDMRDMDYVAGEMGALNKTWHEDWVLDHLFGEHMWADFNEWGEYEEGRYERLRARYLTQVSIEWLDEPDSPGYEVKRQALLALDRTDPAYRAKMLAILGRPA